jgi:hypothetical protein
MLKGAVAFSSVESTTMCHTGHRPGPRHSAQNVVAMSPPRIGREDASDDRHDPKLPPALMLIIYHANHYDQSRKKGCSLAILESRLVNVNAVNPSGPTTTQLPPLWPETFRLEGYGFLTRSRTRVRSRRRSYPLPSSRMPLLRTFLRSIA